MARRQIGQEVFTFVTDPISHRGSLDRVSGLIDWSYWIDTWPTSTPLPRANQPGHRWPCFAPCCWPSGTTYRM